MPSPTIRAATTADAAAINRIYNHYIRHTTITFDTEPWSAARRRRWLAEFATESNPPGNPTATTPYHALVAEADGGVLGFAHNSPLRPKAAYRRATETTIYTNPHNPLRGIGTQLYAALFAALESTDLHRAYAIIALPNPRSLKFHRRFGFTPVGTLSEVGYKFGRYVDVTWLEKALR